MGVNKSDYRSGIKKLYGTSISQSVIYLRINNVGRLSFADNKMRI